MSYDKERVKEAVSVETFARILEALGAELSRTQIGRSSCPIHGGPGSSTDSFHFNPGKDGAVVWNCFHGCGGGDVFELAEKARNLDFPSALEWVAGFTNVREDTPSQSHGKGPRKPASPTTSKPATGRPNASQGNAHEIPDIRKARGEHLARLWKGFHTSDPDGEEFLKTRGIVPDPGTVRFNVGGTGDLKRYRLAVPLHSKDGTLMGFQFRLAQEVPETEKGTRYKNTSGSLEGALFGLAGGVSSWGPEDVVLVCEGMTDYLSATSAGYFVEPNGKRVRPIGFPGAGGAAGIVKDLGPETLKGRSVLLALDLDGPGEKAAQEAARALRAAGIKPFRLTWDPAEGKDVCSFLKGAGNAVKALTGLIQEAAERGPWDPDARDGTAEWTQGLETWERETEKIGLTTGFASIDEAMGGGWRERRLYLLAGLTGTGKSALALEFAQAAAEKGSPVLFVAYELEELEVRARLIARETGIFYGKICAPDLLHEHQRAQVRRAWKTFGEGAGSRIFISNPTPGDRKPKPGSVAWIRDEAARIADRFGKPPLIIVDYLQPAAGFTEDFDPANIRVAVGKTSLELRMLLARGVGAPVLALSSVPRSSYLSPRTGYRFPEMGDLKESGEIEFNADSVSYLWPEKADWEAHEKEDVERDKIAPRPMLFSTVKGRISGTSKIPLEWNPPMGIFRDTGAKYTPPPKKEKAAKIASGKPKEFGLDALRELFVLHGTGVPGGIEIGAERLFEIAKGPQFNAKKTAVNALLATHETSFTRAEREGVKVIRYRTGEAEEEKPKAFDVDALGDLFTLHGVPVPGGVELEEFALVDIAAGPMYGVKKAAVLALLAEHRTGFTRSKRDGLKMILYLTPNAEAESQEAENAAVGDE